MSYQMIHSYVEQVNAGIVDQGEISRRLLEKAALEGAANISTAEGEMWGRAVTAGFVNAAITLGHIKNHQARPKRPDLSLQSHTHEQYLRYLQNVDDRIKEIMEAAKKLRREDFTRIYRPEDFVGKALSGRP